MLTVHVRINDTATGQPTPVRVRFIASDGSTPAPFGRLSSFATAPDADVGGHLLVGSERFFYVDGTCEVRLPPGPITVEASKGPEYSPLRREATLGREDFPAPTPSSAGPTCVPRAGTAVTRG